MVENKNFPKDVVALWPEIFSEVTINVVPLQYVCGIQIVFKNKKIWEVNVNKKLRSSNFDSFQNQINETISRYEDQIDRVDFKLDTNQIKKDIIKKTKKFLKINKL